MNPFGQWERSTRRRKVQQNNICHPRLVRCGIGVQDTTGKGELASNRQPCCALDFVNAKDNFESEI